MEIPSAPSSCGYYFQTTTFQDSSITVDTNSTYPLEEVLGKNRKWKVDFDNMDIYDLDNNVDRGHILNNSQDNNISDGEPSSKQRRYIHMNGSVIKEMNVTRFCWDDTTLIYFFDRPQYGGCTGSCVGCTTCNGCYATIVSTSTCTAGCTSNCASGCTNGCTGGCTAACTDNYEGRYGYDENYNKILVCMDCNTECNNCTSCTACVRNVSRMYCTLATACSGCTTGETVYATYELNASCVEHCQSTLNGLRKDIEYVDSQNMYLNKPECYQQVTDSSRDVSCKLNTAILQCWIVYSCINNNMRECSHCWGSTYNP